MRQLATYDVLRVISSRDKCKVFQVQARASPTSDVGGPGERKRRKVSRRRAILV